MDLNPRAWAEGAPAPYITYFDTGHLTPITWARELFFLGDRPSERASWIVDITGRARCLIQGPGIMIAPGNWLAIVKLLFSREATEHEFQVELHSDRMLGEAAVRPEREGGTRSQLPAIDRGNCQSSADGLALQPPRRFRWRLCDGQRRADAAGPILTP